MLPLKVVNLNKFPQAVSSQPQATLSNLKQATCNIPPDRCLRTKSNYPHPKNEKNSSQDTKDDRQTSSTQLMLTNDVYPMDDKGKPLVNFLPVKPKKKITRKDFKGKCSANKSASICDTLKTKSNSNEINVELNVDSVPCGLLRKTQGTNFKLKSAGIDPGVNVNRLSATEGYAISCGPVNDIEGPSNSKVNSNVESDSINLNKIGKKSSNVINMEDIIKGKVDCPSQNHNLTLPVNEHSSSNPLNQHINNKNKISMFMENCLDPKFRQFILKAKCKPLLGSESKANTKKASNSEDTSDKLRFEPNLAHLALLKARIDSLKSVISKKQNLIDTDSTSKQIKIQSKQGNETKDRNIIILKKLAEQKLAAKKRNVINGVGQEKTQLSRFLYLKHLKSLQKTTEASNQDIVFEKYLIPKNQERKLNTHISLESGNNLHLGKLESSKNVPNNLNKNVDILRKVEENQFHDEFTVTDSKQEKMQHKGLENPLCRKEQMFSAWKSMIHRRDELSQSFNKQLHSKPDLESVPNEHCQSIIDACDNLAIGMVGEKLKCKSTEQLTTTKISGGKQKQSFNNPLMNLIPEQLKSSFQTQPNVQLRTSSCIEKKQKQSLKMDYASSLLFRASYILKEFRTPNWKIDPVSSLLLKALSILLEIRKIILMKDHQQNQNFKNSESSSLQVEASGSSEEKQKQIFKMVQSSTLLMKALAILPRKGKNLNQQFNTSCSFAEKQKYNSKMVQALTLLMKASSIIKEKQKECFKMGQFSCNKSFQSSSSMPSTTVNSQLFNFDMKHNTDLTFCSTAPSSEHDEIEIDSQKPNCYSSIDLKHKCENINSISKRFHLDQDALHESLHLPTSPILALNRLLKEKSSTEESKLQSNSSDPAVLVHPVTPSKNDNTKDSSNFKVTAGVASDEEKNKMPLHCNKTRMPLYNEVMKQNSTNSQMLENKLNFSLPYKLNPQLLQEYSKGGPCQSNESLQLPTAPFLAMNQLLKEKSSTKESKLQSNSSDPVVLVHPISLSNIDNTKCSSNFIVTAGVASLEEKNEMPLHCNQITLPPFNEVMKQNSVNSQIQKNKLKVLKNKLNFSLPHKLKPQLLQEYSKGGSRQSNVLSPVAFPLLPKPVLSNQSLNKDSKINYDHNRNDSNSFRVKFEKQDWCLNQAATKESSGQILNKDNLILNPPFKKHLLNESNLQTSCSHINPSFLNIEVDQEGEFSNGMSQMENIAQFKKFPQQHCYLLLSTSTQQEIRKKHLNYTQIDKSSTLKPNVPPIIFHTPFEKEFSVNEPCSQSDSVFNPNSFDNNPNKKVKCKNFGNKPDTELSNLNSKEFKSKVLKPNMLPRQTVNDKGLIVSQNSCFQKTSERSLNLSSKNSMQIQNHENFCTYNSPGDNQSKEVVGNLQNTDDKYSSLKNKLDICDGKKRRLIVQLERLPPGILNCASLNACPPSSHISNDKCVLSQEHTENNSSAQLNKESGKQQVKRKQSSAVHELVKKQRVLLSHKVKDVEASDNKDCSNKTNVNNSAVLRYFRDPLLSSDVQNGIVNHQNLEIIKQGFSKTKHTNSYVNAKDISIGDISRELPQYIRKRDSKALLKQLRYRIATINSALENLNKKDEYANYITEHENVNQIANVRNENMYQIANESHENVYHIANENTHQIANERNEDTHRIANERNENTHQIANENTNEDMNEIATANQDPIASAIHKNTFEVASTLKEISEVLFKLPCLPKKPSIVLKKLPEYIYEKHIKGKPIMMSSILPTIKNALFNNVQEVKTHQPASSISEISQPASSISKNTHRPTSNISENTHRTASSCNNYENMHQPVSSSSNENTHQPASSSSNENTRQPASSSSNCENIHPPASSSYENSHQPASSGYENAHKPATSSYENAHQPASSSHENQPANSSHENQPPSSSHENQPPSSSHQNQPPSSSYENTRKSANMHRELRVVLYRLPLSKKVKVDLFKLPDSLYDKHKKGKPIMLSNILPTICKVESLNPSLQVYKTVKTVSSNV